MATLTKTQAIRPISRLADAAEAAAISVDDVRISIGETAAMVSPAVVAQIAALLQDLSEGQAVAIAPYDLPVGTELAADLLNVSRPWVAALLDRGEIPMRKNGTKRRVLLGDLMAYRRADARRRREALTWDFLDED